MMYGALKRATICWAKACLWELSIAQIVVGVGLWIAQPFVSPGEPKIVVAMSAEALIFSVMTTFAAAAVYDAVQESNTETLSPDAAP